MSGYEHVDEEAAASRDYLAERVCRELEVAGLPTSQMSGPEFDRSFAGAEVRVDYGAYSSGGVYVTWYPSPDLSGAVAESVRNGQFNDPKIHHSGALTEAMRDALIAILSSGGFSVERSTDDMLPFAIKVLAAPEN
jgi:hypothetical protein